MLSRAEREELFMILSSKLEKEDAEKLERQISTFIIERNNINIEYCKNEIDKLIKNGPKEYLSGRDSHRGAKDLWDISFEGYRNGLNVFWKYCNNKINSNKDTLIEILK